MLKILALSTLAVALFIHYGGQHSSAPNVVSAVIIRDTVVFYKTNEVSTTRAKWLATFVIDFQQFDKCMSKIAEDIRLVRTTLEVVDKKLINGKHDLIAFKNIFDGLAREVQYLEGLRYNMLRKMDQVKSMTHSKRYRRSLLPFVGDALSWLFGTVSESDLRQIRNHISNLATNQKRIVHVVQESLTIINESRILIQENRQSIVDIVKTLTDLDLNIKRITQDLTRKMYENRRFLEMYARLNLLVEEIKTSIWNVRLFLGNLQSQLDDLALGKLSVKTIDPIRLQYLLLEIQDAVPELMALISDPNEDIWSFYRYLTTTTLFTNEKILVILSIPLIRLDNTFEVYRAISIPILSPVDFFQQQKLERSELLATYKLEASGFLIDKARTKFQLLSNAEISSCGNKKARFCTVYSPTYPVSLSKVCLINLFLSPAEAARSYCITQVTEEHLPIARHLFDSSWLIVSRVSLTFAFVCNGRHTEVRSSSPVDIVAVGNNCVASNKYFTLSEPFVIGKSNISYSHYLDLSSANFSDSIAWRPLIEKYPNVSNITIPKQPEKIRDLSLSHLISQIELAKNVDLTAGSTWSFWHYASLVLMLVLVIVVIVSYCFWKSNKRQKCSLPNCLRKVYRVRQQTPASTDVELQPKESGRSDLPAGSAPPTKALRDRIYPYLLGEEDTRL